MEQPLEFEYTPEFYAEKSTRTWLSRIRTVADLKQYEYKPIRQKKITHLKMMYQGHPPEGRGLECGFAAGNSLFWLSKLYKGIVGFDAYDWNPALERIIPLLYRIHKWTLARAVISQGVPPRWRGYDWINCCDYLEHLDEDTYWREIRALYKALKPGGIMGVYVGQAQSVKQHIRIVPPHQTRFELRKVGFTPITDYLYMKETK